MPRLEVPTGGLRVAVPSQPVITPVTTPKMALFLTTLAPSKAAGVAGIRISNVNTDIQLEELDAHVNRIIEFVLHPIVNNDTKKVTAVAITQMGLSGTPHLLSPAQRAALALITNELKQFKAAGLANTAIATS
jgi:hypothetical protein